MSRMMIQAAVTMNQLQNKLDLIGNNIANIETTGYKSRQADFASLLFQQMNNMTDSENADERMTPDGIRVGSGAKLGAISNHLALGSIYETGRDLDSALLHKNHFFQIEVTAEGNSETQYTRDGTFYLNPTTDGDTLQLVTKDGYPVIGANGPIEIPEGFDRIQILPNGQISAILGNQTEVVGTLSIVEAVRPRLLEAVGQNAFRLPDMAALGLNAEEAIELVGVNEGLLKSKALEQSNVDLSEQMTDMIMAQRSYQFNARTISMGDQMSGLINQLR